jgi:hypothetical protein
MYMEAKLGISLYSYPYLNWQKLLVLLINAYTLSLTKLEIKAKQYLLGSEGVGARGRGGEKGRGLGEGGSNDPMIVCTYE